ncbi:TPA: hypothetical protein DIC20_02770 [Candidatus Dependentiae bacterium]|nr:MAG: hypothetical protein US03_C0009G0015 [candidate division TM6 bacterium GW2011_GWF2_36_131]KKQ02853.1 MAG: hypothetical protein US13_C0009G0045 [candidate division TM6 bacterium GW2011_GWE2_36_25]KKQ19506.1 MAG: hypothetical protein US32_C0008G0007 [candidate division TM6 bacterium GW2011_GWA2_36_9]HBR70219.1 hypothetical protein [Candidatus Dependentiae bacterium]HCU00603.1 hypothetical protein [Candidatus Dependentiae bacterium]
MKKLSICMLLLIFSINARKEKEVDGKKEIPAEVEEVKTATCPICLSDIEPSEAILTCEELCEDGDARHIFHKECLTRQLKEGVGVYGCPVCRKPLKDELEKEYVRVRSDDDHGLDLPTLLSIFASEGREVREVGPGIILVRPSAHDELESDESYPHDHDFVRILAESRRDAEARDLAERRRAAERRFARGFFGLGDHRSERAEERDLEAALEESSRSVARNDLSERGRTEEIGLAARRRDAERRFASGFVRGLSSNRNSEEPRSSFVGRAGHEEASADNEILGSMLSLVHALTERDRVYARARELVAAIELRHRLEALERIFDGREPESRERDHEDDHGLPGCRPS